MAMVSEPRAESKRETGQESFVLEAASAMSASLVAKAVRVFSHSRLSIAVRGVLAVASG